MTLVARTTPGYIASGRPTSKLCLLNGLRCRLHRWVPPISCIMYTTTNKQSQWGFVNSVKLYQRRNDQFVPDAQKTAIFRTILHLQSDNSGSSARITGLQTQQNDKCLSSFFDLGFEFSTDGIGHGGFVQCGVVQMCIDLCGVQIAVTEDFLERACVHAVF